MEEIKKIPQRNEIAVEDTWATEDLYPSDEAWASQLPTLEEDKNYILTFAGRLCESAETLYTYLRYTEEMEVKLSRLANYCMRKADEDTRNTKYQAMVGQLMSLYVGLSAAQAFETPEIMALSDEALDAFYAEYPALERYRRMLTNTRRRKLHTLSAPEEKLLAAAGEMSGAPDTIYGAFANADLTFPDAIDAQGNAHPVSQGTFVA